MTNPLLETNQLPKFSQVKPEHVVPAIDELLANNRTELQALLNNDAGYSWDNLMQPLEEMGNRLHCAWSTVSHMNAVVNSESLRKAYNECLPKLADYGTELAHNVKLYEAIKALAESPEYASLNAAKRKIISNQLRDFRLEGVALPSADKKHYAELRRTLSELTSKFEENILDATHGWTLLITDEKELAGLPEHALAAAKQQALAQNKQGWLFTLDIPSYLPVMQYAHSAALRKEMYDAYITRASDKGVQAGRWDNTQVMADIVRTRMELAKLLSFDNYAQLSLATKMVENPNQVLEFLADLVHAAHAQAAQEFSELTTFAQSQYGVSQLNPWDVAYYSERLSEQKYHYSQEDLRPYFPAPQILQGLFELVQKLFGIVIKEKKGVEVWHPQVQFFEIYDAQNQLTAQFYLDLYARPHKRGGAWMDDCRGRYQLSNGDVQIPVAFLTCNFTQPVGDEPALLTHDEVLTLFHEFGHGLQHMLTRINELSVSGINGVAWDAVEVASQFMENWCWEKTVIDMFAKHYKTGVSLPAELYAKMIAAKNFQSAMQMVRQLEFALFDMRLYITGDDVQQTLDQVRKEVSVVPVVDYNRFQHGFSHIFAGGYAAGYYSYKWAEVMSSDAFAKFEEEGLFSKEVGKHFLETFLELGGAYEPSEVFMMFRGRMPKIDALLRHSGITVK